MDIDRKMAMAENALAAVIDCLEGIVSEMGFEGIAQYVNDPERMLAEAKAAREYIHGYAYGCGTPPARPKRTTRR